MSINKACSDDGTGKLLVWGCGEFGQHGHGHQNDITLSTGLSNPLLLGQDVLVAKVACGSSHTVCITDDNRIYSWGNGDSGQLGIGQSKTVCQPHSVQVGVSLGTRVDGVTCGTRHTFVWSENGECYSFGNNFTAQLGYDFRKPDFKDNQPSPVYLETLFDQKVVQVACGSRHSLFLFNSGCIASVGSNDRGQLGIGSRVESVCVKNVPDMQDIAVIGCGNCHCLAADGIGHLYVWGYGKACGSKEDILEPSCIYSYDDRQVTALEGGDSHSMLLLEDGSLYSWGVNFEGQLGLGEHIKFQSSPAEVKSKALQGHVLSISVGENTSAATTENGELLMWGRNVSQVFRDDEGPRYCQFYPFLVSLGNWKAVKVSCGSWHVACVVVPSAKQLTTRLSSFESRPKSDLSEILFKNENSTLPSDYLGLSVTDLDLSHEGATDHYTNYKNNEFVPDKSSDVLDNTCEIKDTQMETNETELSTYSKNKPIHKKMTSGHILSSSEIANHDHEFTCNDTILDLTSSEKSNSERTFTDVECASMSQLSCKSEVNGDLKEPISNAQKMAIINIANENRQVNSNEEENKQLNESEVEKPSSAPGNVITRSKVINSDDDTARGTTKLRRTQSEDSSVCKKIFDLVSTKHGNTLHYSRSFSDVTVDKQHKFISQQQGNADKAIQGYTSAKDDITRHVDGNAGSLWYSPKATDNNYSTNITTKQIKFTRQTTGPTVAEDDKNISDDRNTGVHTYTAKPTDVLPGNIKTTQFKLTGHATGQLNRQKKAPRHLRRAPLTPEYSLPNQPIHNTYTRHNKQLQRTQSSPNINISGQKLDVQLSSSTPTSPPSRSHVPHPPNSTRGLPPRPHGTRKPNSQKIFYSSGSSWRRRTTIM